MLLYVTLLTPQCLQLLTCLTADWGRAPNFLLVDYYNNGSGSVFEVAARYNKVTYNRPCCGTNQAISEASSMVRSLAALIMGIGSVICIVW